LGEDELGLEHPLVAETLTRQGAAHLDADAPASAEAVLRRAEAILAAKAGDPLDRAEIALLLARALEGRDPANARHWAQTAQEHAVRAGEPGQTLRAEAQAWLGIRSASGATGPRETRQTRHP